MSKNNKRTWLPSAGTLLGLLALTVALGGTAAANLPGNNSVISSDIKNNNVKAPDIKANAVRQSDIATDSVGADELKTTWIVGSGQSVTAGTSNSATANCPAGYQVISGGFNWDLSVAGLYTTSLEINTGSNSATVVGYNDSANNRTLSARVYCISS